MLSICIVAKISKLVDQCCWALRRQKQSPDQMLNSTGNQTNQRHSPTLYLSQQRRAATVTNKTKDIKEQLKYPRFSKWWKILKRSSNNSLHGSFNAISRTEIRQTCVIYIIDSSEFPQKRNWKWRNLNFPFLSTSFPAQSEKLLRSWWGSFLLFITTYRKMLKLKDFLSL